MGREFHLASTIISEVAQSLGLTVEVEPEYHYAGQIKTPDGRIFYFKNTNFDLNGQGAAEVAQDKGYAAYFMNKLGYSVPRGDTFYSDRWCSIIKSDKNTAAAIEYANKLGYPLFVKPNSRSQGVGVEKVLNDQGLQVALGDIFEDLKEKVAVVQEPIPGDDYRIVVLDNEVISAYQRLPLSVIGEGNKSIRELLGKKQFDFRKFGRDTFINIDQAKMHRKLERSDLNLDSKPEQGEKINLLDNANLSTGGDAVDFTETIHPTFKSLAISVARDMNLRYCGVDIITESPIQEALKKYSIIEINAAPGLDHYAYLGNKQQLIVRDLYTKVLIAMTK